MQSFTSNVSVRVSVIERIHLHVHVNIHPHSAVFSTGTSLIAAYQK